MSLPPPPVLVINDERNMRLSLKAILHGEGYDVQMVESAAEALVAQEKLEFLMVITDAKLGKMSGYEFLAQACKRWPSVPFLTITAIHRGSGRRTPQATLVIRDFITDGATLTARGPDIPGAQFSLR